MANQPTRSSRITVRITPDLRDRLEVGASEGGVTLARYAEQRLGSYFDSIDSFKAGRGVGKSDITQELGGKEAIKRLKEIARFYRWFADWETNERSNYKLCAAILERHARNSADNRGIFVKNVTEELRNVIETMYDMMAQDEQRKEDDDGDN